MTQEEKLEEAKRLYKTANADQRYVLESLFPELKESEDERIRKWLISDLKDSIDSCAYCERTKPQALEAIAWLEKQGRKQPTWSEEDEEHENTIIRAIHGAGNITPIDGELAEKWLKSLKQRLEEQKDVTPADVGLAELGKIWEEEQLQVDGFDAELNALLKKYEHLQKYEIIGCLNFYIKVVEKTVNDDNTKRH